MPPKTAALLGAFAMTAVSCVGAELSGEDPATTAGLVVAGTNTLTVASSGKCLAVVANAPDDGALIEQRTCTGADTQRWNLRR